VPAVISAAEITGADAIHPGYGFLSESAYLAEVCEACHIKFIGPDPQVIRLMGDKARARRVMKKAGVPILPGSDGPLDNEEKALKLAKEIGYPVIVKATAGGGGRGMRVVRAPAELSHAVKTAQREAEAAFGVGDVYIEKYVESPRHIEFQVLGDHHGAVIHLGERECSIQRRHQKLLEESPSVALSDKMRRRMGAIVIDAAKAVQYTNAGTFEFLMDPGGRFYFMEANTRLQVEHPVTEMVTGVDIVKEQIRIASGERLTYKQGDVTFTGHSIECRVNAEDPDTFVPSPGVIHVFSVPGGPGVRVETFAHSDCTISPYYDSMIAKIIVHGRDRQEAIARMKRTLEMTVIEGIKTTIPLHLRILADPDFVAGKLSTSFMDRFLARPSTAASPRRSRDSNIPASALRLPRLNAIVDVEAAERAGWTPIDLTHAFLAGGARFLQLRAKHLTGRRFSRDQLKRLWSSRGRSAPRSSSTTAPISRGFPAPTACISVRRICRRWRFDSSSARVPSSASHAHGRAARAGARRTGQLHRDRTGVWHGDEAHGLRCDRTGARGRRRPAHDGAQSAARRDRRDYAAERRVGRRRRRHVRGGHRRPSGNCRSRRADAQLSARAEQRDVT
jgi:acetyl-CoA carboxylase biotin carboxylase subunit